MKWKILALLFFIGMAGTCLKNGGLPANPWNISGMFFVCLYGFIICELCQKDKPDWQLECNVLSDIAKALIRERAHRTAICKEALAPSKKELVVTMLQEHVGQWDLNFTREKAEILYFDLSPFIHFSDPAKVQKAVDLMEGGV